MSASPANSRIPLGKFAWWVLAALLAAPLLFFALVTPPDKSYEPPPKVELPPSKLQAVGLRENRDWDGLPEMFAVWAERVEWIDGRSQFAFWNPGSQSYSYFFEAKRDESHPTFRTLTRKEVFRGRTFFADGTYRSAGSVRRHDDPEPVEEFRESTTHPFIFFKSGDVPIAAETARSHR